MDLCYPIVMKRLFGILSGFFIVLLFMALIFHKDVPAGGEKHSYKPSPVVKTPQREQDTTITIDGVDYYKSGAQNGKFGGEFFVSTIGEGPKTFNPFNAMDATSSTMGGIMYDGLLTSDPATGEVIPLLAKSFSISPDGREYTINLRRGIKWSDGQPITVEDVIYTYKEIIFAGLGNTSTRDMMVIDGKLPEVVKIDDYTVKFITSEPFAPFLRQLSTPIAPKHVFKPVSDKGADAFNTFLSTDINPKDLVTSGAFRLKEYVPAQRVVYERNPNYYKVNDNNEKLPYLDKIVYFIVADLNNEILKFEAKEIDMITLRGSNVARYKAKEPNSDYTVYNLGPDTGTMFITINLNNRKNKDGKYNVSPIKQEWFGNKNFRTAVDYALDRKSMVMNIANGLGVPLFTAESLNSIYLNKSITGHERDLNKAREILLQGGFYYDEKGKLRDKNTNYVEFDLFTNAGNTEREALGVMVKQDIEDLGIKVNFKPVEFNSLVNKLVNTYDYDMAIMGLTGSPLEPHSGKNVWYSSGPLHMFNQRPAGYNTDDRLDMEKELDYIFDEAALKTTFDERKKLYDRYQEIIYDEKPMIYLYSPTRIIAARKYLKNLYPTSLSGIGYNLDEIFIDKGN